MSGRGGATWPIFPTDTLRRLFDAVDVNDVVDAQVELPDRIELACSEDTMRRCFALCLQLWEEGFSRSELLQLVQKLLRGEELSAVERLQYKNIRARYKHLRFAQRLYSQHHEANHFFDLTTRTLGKLQDAFRCGQRDAIDHYAVKLRRLLTRPVWELVRYTTRHTRLDSAEGFVAYRQAEMRRLQEALAPSTLTGHEFHMMRKIVSMHVSFYDTLRSLEPCAQAYKMSRFLAAINGLMGASHDEMVTESLSGRRSYEAPTLLLEETRWRLEMLVAHYPLNAATATTSTSGDAVERTLLRKDIVQPSVISYATEASD